MSHQRSRGALERAIMCTVSYSDVFDYPLTEGEVHRYLDGVAATPAEVSRALDGLSGPRLCSDGDMVALAGRDEVFAVRRRRQREAERLWPAARRWGRLVGRLPLVRMVAVTGALAVDNVKTGADIDYLIVTVPGRVWLCRSMIIQMVRLARLRGVVLCPNWVLAADALSLENHTLFAAREMTQMVPIVGLELYRRTRELNPWVDELLPNAAGPPRAIDDGEHRRSRLTALGERVLQSRAGSAVEDWERRRKTREILGSSPANPEVVLDDRQCKGHVDAHGVRITRAYTHRLRALGLEPPQATPPVAAI